MGGIAAAAGAAAASAATSERQAEPPGDRPAAEVRPTEALAAAPPPPAPPPADPAPPAAETDRQALRAAAEREALARLDQSDQGGAPAPSRADRENEPRGPTRDELIARLQRAEEYLEERRSAEEKLARELVETEDRLAARQRDTESALREMLDRIGEAERRARSAEDRARWAVEKASAGPPVRQAEAGLGAAPVPPAESASEASGPGAERDRPAGSDEPLSINSATYEDLRTLGLSVTQTGRVLAHRERGGGFRSLDDLDEIPGFEAGFLEVLKVRLRI